MLADLGCKDLLETQLKHSRPCSMKGVLFEPSDLPCSRKPIEAGIATGPELEHVAGGSSAQVHDPSPCSRNHASVTLKSLKKALLEGSESRTLAPLKVANELNRHPAQAFISRVARQRVRDGRLSKDLSVNFLQPFQNALPNQAVRRPHCRKRRTIAVQESRHLPDAATV